ncbi:hypothetical protein CYJ73_18675 [Gordonia terrae]|uniref:Prokaryotic metallothionein n=1 Tax=Gordonia terrae TaxID=2055 RepID=A0A2I1R4U5_9ACTN|nr:hypothetical protein [Gordonia terrae]PKZ64147.1 hypothetical protein CYJ73_18675 [Gordonia terrae]
MATCDTCGNDYDRAMTISIDNRGQTIRGVFDSFECAIAQLAPQCARCGCRVLGHGWEVDDTIYCCAHCARSTGAADVSDRVTSTESGDGEAKIFQ